MAAVTVMRENLKKNIEFLYGRVLVDSKHIFEYVRELPFWAK